MTRFGLHRLRCQGSGQVPPDPGQARPARGRARPTPSQAPRSRLVLSALAIVAGAPALGLGAGVVAAGPASASTLCTGQIGGVTVVAGSGQVAKVDNTYPSGLEAEVVDSGGCPVVGANVEFVVPTSGASGFFPGDAVTVTVATNNQGVASAPALTANEVSGSFSVEASVAGYSTDFQLTNTTVGSASSVTVSGSNTEAAHTGDAFGQPLAVNVLDAYGDPVAGATVDFSVVTTAAGAGATFAGGGATASAVTDEDGTATSPVLTAGSTVGAFTVTAAVSGTTSTATFSLADLAGAPDAIAAGVGTSQSTELGTDFAVPLAVTVTDADGNVVAGASVTFAGPASGASGLFAGAGTTATVLANPDGVATAPDFSANQHAGGYVVTARVAGVAAPATFALVNEPRTTASAPGPDGTYWLVTSTGKVLSSGGATRYGPVKTKLASAVVAMAAGPGNDGYWVVTAKGAVYAIGAAVNYGSPFQSHLVKPIVGIAATPDGQGYWLVAADGGMFNYGDAKYYGSPGNSHLAKPIVGIAATLDGKGYWLATSAGQVYAYGDAVSFGPGLALSPAPVKALVRTADGAGYWLVSANGTAAGFGDAGAQGSPMSNTKAIVGGAA